jgi:hypothetical protein
MLKYSNSISFDIMFCFHGAAAPSGPGPSHYRGFTITLRHTTLRRTPLDQWSARRRDLYLTIHNTHKRQTSMPPARLEPTIAATVRAPNPRLTPRGHWDRPTYGYRHISTQHNAVVQKSCASYRPGRLNFVRWCPRFSALLQFLFLAGGGSISLYAPSRKPHIIEFTGHSRTVGPQHAICVISPFWRVEFRGGFVPGSHADTLTSLLWN